MRRLTSLHKIFHHSFMKVEPFMIQRMKQLASFEVFYQVYRHIFTGPTSAINPKETGGTKSKARLFKITSVTSRTIAYACIQARKNFIYQLLLYYWPSKSLHCTFRDEMMEYPWQPFFLRRILWQYCLNVQGQCEQFMGWRDPQLVARVSPFLICGIH